MNLDSLYLIQNLGEDSIWPMLAQESLKALGGLGLLSLGGKYLLRRVFEVCHNMFSNSHFLDIFFLNRFKFSLTFNKFRLLLKRGAPKLSLLSAY